MSAIPQGAIRFNTDSQKLEFYAQDQWWEMVIDSPNLGTSSDTTAGARGVIAGGSSTPSVVNNIEYVNISSTGNARDFGDLTGPRGYFSSCSSSTRGVWGGGYVAPIPSVNVIDYVTISSTGDAQDFGDLSQPRHGTSACSSSTRGVFAGGFLNLTNTNLIEYITISSTGKSVYFGDRTLSIRAIAACSSSTRGIFAGGYSSPTVNSNVIDFITLSTLGNALDFGDMTFSGAYRSGCSNSVRGVIAGGYVPGTSPASRNIIDYITIATLGNAVDFGDLTTSSRFGLGACSSSTRGVFGGGTNPATNAIEYVNISTQSNAVYFGDLTLGRGLIAACSNAHGGL